MQYFCIYELNKNAFNIIIFVIFVINLKKKKKFLNKSNLETNNISN